MRVIHLAMIIMIMAPVVSAVAADPGNFSAAGLTLLGAASASYVLWNLVGTRSIMALALRENVTMPPIEIRGPRCGTGCYFTIQIALGGLVYHTADQGHIPNLIWLVLLPPVAYAVFLSGWRCVAMVSLLMISLLAASAYRWQGLTYATFATVAFSFAVLFTLAFSLLAVDSERARSQVQRLASELEAANHQLRAYSVQAEELAVTRERNRIAREIHDSLGHYLTVVNVQIEAARTWESSDPARARAAIARAQAFAQDGLQDIRCSLASLRESPLDNKSLTDAVRELVSASNGAGLATEYELQGTPRPLASPAELSLYRAVQEGLTNARKHAQAGRVRVILAFQAANKTSAIIEDNGMGTALANSNSGFGLLGLRERANLLGGTVQVESGPNAGFILKMEVPG